MANNALRRTNMGLLIGAGVAGMPGLLPGGSAVTTTSKPATPAPLPAPPKQTWQEWLQASGYAYDPSRDQPAVTNLGAVSVSRPTSASGFIPAQQPQGGYAAPGSPVFMRGYASWGRITDSAARRTLREQYQYGNTVPTDQQLYELETNPQKKAEWGEKKAEWEEANKPDPYAAMNERIQELMQNLIGKYETSTEETHRANIDRYEDILGQRSKLIESTMEDVKGYGAAEQKEIERGYAKESGRIGANLAARGLSATTIGPALQMGLARRKIGSLAQLRERTGMMKAQLRGGLTEEKLRFMERREDVEPDLGMIAQLLRRVGAGTLPQLLKKAKA